MYIFTSILCLLLIIYGIYRKNPVVPLSEGRKPFNWLSIITMSFTSAVACMFVLNPSIEFKSLEVDPLLNVFEYKTNPLAILWSLGNFSFFIAFFVLVLFSNKLSKKFLMLCDIVSIIAICGSFSGMLRYLDKLDYSGISIIAISCLIFLVSIFLSRKEKYIKYTCYFNYTALLSLGLYFVTLNKIDYTGALKELITYKSLNVITHAHESQLINEYTGWVMGWFWIGARFMRFICEGHRIFNCLIAMVIGFFVSCYMWFLVNEGADLSTISDTTKNIILVIAITTFLTSFNALIRNIYSVSKKNFVLCIIVMIGILLLTYFGFINVFVCSFYGFIASLIYWCSSKIIYR